MLRWFARCGLLEAADAPEMLVWAHGGFSRDAAVRVAGDGPAGLERLLRQGVRPALALEQLTQIDADRVIYRLPKPPPHGRTELPLTPPGIARAAQRVDPATASASPP